MSTATINPYLNNLQLSSLEQEVLWEYAKLGDKTKRIATLARDTTISPNDSLLTELRQLEKKMGLVLTLFKASVWAIIQESRAEEMDEANAREENQRLEALKHHRGDDSADSSYY